MKKDKNKVKSTLDDKILNLNKQLEDSRNLFFKIQGALEILDELKKEDDEKTD